MRFEMRYLFSIVFIVTLADLAESIKKPYRLKVLAHLPLTGSEPIDFRQCLAAEAMVVNIVNNRTDLLPDYRVEFEFQDEGLSGMTAVREAIRFIRNVDDDPTPGLFLAPISVGTLYTPGCKSWGSTAHHMNMVMVAGSCTAPSQTANRAKYPNMYRVRSPSQLALVSRLPFLRKVAPRVNKIVIVSIMNMNSYNLEASTYFSDISIKSGFEIVSFAASPDFNDDFMQNLKQKDYRIFTVEMAEPQAGQLFLCQAYRAGIKGPKYLFIFQLLSFTDANLLPEYLYSPTCTRENHKEQLRQALFIGSPYQIFTPPGGVTSLGHSLEDFERLFGAATNYEKKSDFNFRHLCYDLALEALMILNDTETNLAKKGMSLRDYRSHPVEVMQAANNSAKNIRFHMLRFGEFKYSERLEWDYEPQYVAVWTEDKGLHPRYKISLAIGAKAENVSAYMVEQLIPLDFAIPRDAPTYETIPRDVSDVTFAITVTVCLLFCIGQGIIFVSTVRPTTSSQFSVKVFFLTNFILIDIGSILSIPYADIRNTYICNIQIVVIAIGISFIQGLTVFKMHHSLVIFLKAQKARSIIAERLDGAQLRKTLALTFAYCIANCIVVAAWLSSDPVTAQRIIHSAPVYNSKTDTFTQFQDISCTSSYGDHKMVVLIVGNLFFLLVSILMLIKSRKIDKNLATPPFLTDVKELQMAIIFSSTLLLAIVAICYIALSVFMRDLTITYGLLIYSGAMAVITNYVDLSKYFAKAEITPSLSRAAGLYLHQPGL